MDPSKNDRDIESRLEQRLGRLHARQRLGIEGEDEARVFGGGLNFFHLENWYSVHSVIRNTLRLTGLYGRGRRNAERVALRRNTVVLPRLSPGFEGFTILQLSDLHLEISEAAIRRTIEMLPEMHYDIAVLTGDFRAGTVGRFDGTIVGLARLRRHLQGRVFGVLGNHDTIRMVPEMEDMGIRMLLNEAETIARGDERIHLAGIDDAHYFRVDNIEKAASGIPHDEVAILLSHTPEIYRRAAHAGFDLMLSGHTHGGQICLPGGIPITLDARLPRRFGAGAWRYHGMQGYTASGTGSCIVAVRFNCPPEITLHRLTRG
jgi:predicted MPP superfamily phosphohydrolase